MRIKYKSNRTTRFHDFFLYSLSSGRSHKINKVDNRCSHNTGQRSRVRGQQSHPSTQHTLTHTYTTKDIQRHKIVQSFTTDVNEEAFSVFLNFVPNRKRVENSRSIKGEEFLIQSVCDDDHIAVSRMSVHLSLSSTAEGLQYFCVCVSLLFWTLQVSVVWS